MLFKQINRKDPETVFGIFKNGDASALVDGDLVVHVTGASADGKTVNKSAAAALLLTVAGIVGGNGIAVGEYGPVLTYGYHGNAKSSAATAGSGMASAATAGTVGNAALADNPTAHIGLILTDTASGRSKVWVRCM